MDGLVSDYISAVDDEFVSLSSQIETGVITAPTGPPGWEAKRDAAERSLAKTDGFNQTDRENLSNPLVRSYRRAGQELTVRAGGLAIVDQLAEMRAKGSITDAEAAAGERWRIDWIAYTEGFVEGSGRTGTGKSFDQAHGSQLAMVKAGARCRDVRDGIGIISERLLVMTIIEGNSATAIGKKIYPNAGEAVARLKAAGKCHGAIQALAERYEFIDNRQKPKQPTKPAPIPSKPTAPL